MKPHKSSSLSGHKAIITSLQFIYSRNQLLSASEDGELRLWNIETLKCLQILREHKKGIIAIIDIPKFRIFITGIRGGGRMGGRRKKGGGGGGKEAR